MTVSYDYRSRCALYLPVTLIRVLSTSQRIASAVTSVDTQLDNHSGTSAGSVDLVAQYASRNRVGIAAFEDPAAKTRVHTDSRDRSSGLAVLEEVDPVRATVGLIRIAVARHIAVKH